VDQELQVTYMMNGKYGDHGNTLLHRAVAHLSDVALPALIRALGPGLQSAPNAHKQYPIHFALALGKIATVDALAAMELQEPDVFGNSLLHYALTGRAVDWVMKNRAVTKLEVKNMFQLTPLMHAFACGSHDAISALLGYDCDPTEPYNSRIAISMLDVRARSTLCLPFTDDDVWVPGAFRIPVLTAAAAAASPQDKKQLVQGLSRRSSMTIKKGASSAVVIQIGNSKF